MPEPEIASQPIEETFSVMLETRNPHACHPSGRKQSTRIVRNSSSEETVMSTTMPRPAPQPAAQAVTGAAPMPASLPDSTAVTRRRTADKVRPVDLAALVDVRDLTVPGGPVGQTWLRIFRPASATRPLAVVMYVHGDDPVLGNARTRRLVTKLTIDLQAAVVVVDYSLSPKARYPIAIEENYAAATWVAQHGNEHGLDATRIALAADSASGDMAAELMVMADERGGPALAAHVLFTPKATAVLRAALAD
jgi:acetyl esterase